jgi:hypothetical protein
MIRFSLIGLILIITQLFTGCNSCDCDEGNGLEGFYTCSRKETKNQEFLWLFKNEFYVHILSYDTVVYINSDSWAVEKSNQNIELFIAKNWVAPCESGRTYCYERMDYVAKHNFESYKGSDAQLEFGCYNGLDDTCYFRLMATYEPMYNYKRIGDEFYKLDLKGKRIEFYTERDSVVFSSVVNDKNILK